MIEWTFITLRKYACPHYINAMVSWVKWACSWNMYNIYWYALDWLCIDEVHPLYYYSWVSILVPWDMNEYIIIPYSLCPFDLHRCNWVCCNLRSVLLFLIGGEMCIHLQSVYDKRDEAVNMYNSKFLPIFLISTRDMLVVANTTHFEHDTSIVIFMWVYTYKVGGALVELNSFPEKKCDCTL